MKRKGFTLVEALSVIAVLALLLMILLPSLRTSKSLTRRAICQHNLRQIGSAFAASLDARVAKGTEGSLARLYPEGPKWPACPMDTVADARIYRCPEDETATGEDGLGKLVYWYNPFGGIQVDLSKPPNGAWFISRTGSDENGAYVDYDIEDDGSTAGVSFHGWLDIDGTFRVYLDTGTVWVMTDVPNTPEWSGAYPGWSSGLNSCGDPNYLYYEGKPASGDGCLRTLRGQKFVIPGWGGVTNYGLNTYAFKAGAGGGNQDVIVLTDYKKHVADPDDPVNTYDKLQKSARHLGKLNTLCVDGSVRVQLPLQISPAVVPWRWYPK